MLELYKASKGTREGLFRELRKLVGRANIPDRKRRELFDWMDRNRNTLGYSSDKRYTLVELEEVD